MLLPRTSIRIVRGIETWDPCAMYTVVADTTKLISPRTSYLRNHCTKQEKQNQQPEECWPRMNHMHRGHQDASEDAASGEFVSKQRICDQASSGCDLRHMTACECAHIHRRSR